MNASHSSIFPADEEVFEDFFYSLRRSRLLPEEQVDGLKADAQGRDVHSLSDWLVREGLLTPFQCKQIVEGESRGLVVGPYVVLDELGEGGFGKVYRAVHKVMKREVALKVIAPSWVKESEARQLFLREIVGATPLEHPNIALAYDADQEEDILYLAMEFIDGPTLARFVGRHGALPVPFASAVVLQVARALKYTHRQRVVHRDIKPANILLSGVRLDSAPADCPGGEAPFVVKVIDFGLARLYPRGAASPCTLMRGDHLVGTPEFMAPEQAWDFHQADIRSDLYSLGCTFYFALTGKFPLRGRSQMETVMKQLEQEAKPVREVRPDIPPEVAAIVQRLLLKDPGKRFQTPAELILALRYALRETTWDGPGSVPPPLPLPQPSGSSVTATAEASPPPGAGDAGASGTKEEDTGLPAPCPEEDETGEDPVRSLWAQWQAVLAEAALGSDPALPEGAYRSLHRRLLEALRAHSGSSAPRAPLYARLESFVEPWLTFRSLAELDRQSQVRLWAECQQLDAELPRRRNGLGSAAFWLLVGLGLTGGVYALKFLFGVTS